MSSSYINSSILSDVTITSSPGIVTKSLVCTGDMTIGGTLAVNTLVVTGTGHMNEMGIETLYAGYMAAKKLRIYGKFITTRKSMKKFLKI
jgi:hypothetical protein